MGLLNWEERAKRMSLLDIILDILGVFIFGIAIGAYLTTYFRPYVLWIVALAVVLWIRPAYKFVFYKKIAPTY